MKSKCMHPSHRRGNAWGQLDSEVKRVQDPAWVLGWGKLRSHYIDLTVTERDPSLTHSAGSSDEEWTKAPVVTL